MDVCSLKGEYTVGVDIKTFAYQQSGQIPANLMRRHIVKRQMMYVN